MVFKCLYSNKLKLTTCFYNIFVSKYKIVIGIALLALMCSCGKRHIEENGDDPPFIPVPPGTTEIDQTGEKGNIATLEIEHNL